MDVDAVFGGLSDEQLDALVGQSLEPEIRAGFRRRLSTAAVSVPKRTGRIGTAGVAGADDPEDLP